MLKTILLQEFKKKLSFHVFIVCYSISRHEFDTKKISLRVTIKYIIIIPNINIQY